MFPVLLVLAVLGATALLVVVGVLAVRRAHTLAPPPPATPEERLLADIRALPVDAGVADDPAQEGDSWPLGPGGLGAEGVRALARVMRDLEEQPVPEDVMAEIRAIAADGGAPPSG